MFPTRYSDLDHAALRDKHGQRGDELAPFFLKGDELADDLVALFARLPPKRGTKLLEQALEHGIGTVPHAPTPLRTLFEHVEAPPPWLDQRLLDLGGRTQLRCGVISGLVLSCACLPLSYRSAAGVKPLMFTGELYKRSIRRMSETNRFYIENCLPDGLQTHNPGWKLSIRIRIMHAQIRRLLAQGKSRPWRADTWGVPINQVDLAATLLLFSACALKHLRQVGFYFSAKESEAVMHLWRYCGHLCGVVPELLCTTESEGNQLLALLLDMAGGPDPDSHRLAEALMGTALPTHFGALLPWLVPFNVGPDKPRAGTRVFHGLPKRLGLQIPPETLKTHISRFCYGLSHGLLGRGVASDLNYPPTAWSATAPMLLRSLIAPLELCRRLTPGGTRLASYFGHRQIQRLMRSKLFARPAAVRNK